MTSRWFIIHFFFLFLIGIIVATSCASNTSLKHTNISTNFNVKLIYFLKKKVTLAILIKKKYYGIAVSFNAFSCIFTSDCRSKNMTSCQYQLLEIFRKWKTDSRSNWDIKLQYSLFNYFSYALRFAIMSSC